MRDFKSHSHNHSQRPVPFPCLSPILWPRSCRSRRSHRTFGRQWFNRFSLNVQGELHQGWLLGVGYVGTRGTHLQRLRSLNQALDAFPAHPINGVTSNTLANIPLRAPVPGIRPDSLREMDSEGESWYNGFEVSLTKRLSHGIQFLASYTFSKTEDTDGSEINGVSAANTKVDCSGPAPSTPEGFASQEKLLGFPCSRSQTRIRGPFGRT